MFVVPLAARTACWLNAWLSGRESADAAIDALACTGDVEFTWDRGETPLSPALLLGELRAHHTTKVTPALPVPGHLLGLGGPPGFNADALEAGGALVLHGSDRGFVPISLGRRTRWVGAAAVPAAYLPDVASAEHELNTAIREATEALVALDVTSWSPDAADALLNLRAPTRLDAPMAFASPRAERTALAALRAQAIVQLAADDGSGPVSVSETVTRDQALRPLLYASHQALVASCGSLDGR